MHAADPLSSNVFGRLFSYTPRSDAREPIEDFCTEALAWCLLSSKKFAGKFLRLLRDRLQEAEKLGPNLQAFADQFDVWTQLSFTGDPNEEEAEEEKGASPGRFDLVIQPQTGESFIIVIESKVHFDPSIDSQIQNYERALKKHPKFRHYSERYVFSLTPWTPDASANCARLTWQNVHQLVDDEIPPSENPVLRQFAEFLKSRNLSSLKLMKLKTQQLEHLQQIAPFFDDAKNLFGRFQNEPKLKAIFKRHLERPVIDYDNKTDSTWYGIYTGSRNAWVYAGFWLKPREIILYVQFSVDGDRRSWAKELPTMLAEAAKDAASLFGKLEIEKGETGFRFTKRLTPDLADHPEQVFYWFKTTLETAESFLQKQIKNRKA
jgi:PD-(D/E)XK nuclease superfamily